MEFLAFIVMMVIVVVLSLGIVALCNGIADRREKKRKRMHPYLYAWFAECEGKELEASRYYNSEIGSRKRKIDTIINEMPYYPMAVKAEKEAELEDLRNAIYLATFNYEELESELKELRTRIHNYVEEHDLKWAKDWGW